MAGHTCFHCKARIEAGHVHDCWTTTEAALTKDLSEDLSDAWERLRETAVEFGEQRIYASHHSIMFSRTACYFFVRPRTKYLELCIFLGRRLKTPVVKKAVASSRAKIAHIVHVRHRDEVEPPLTDWLREAYEASPTLGARAVAKTGVAARPGKASRTRQGSTRKR